MRETRLAVAPPLPIGVYSRRPSPELPFPLETEGSAVFARARHALWKGIQGLGLRRGDGVLVPAYHHGSEIEALLRAGLELSFYEAGADLEPDADELESLLGPRVRALYLIHYLGFPQDVARWRTWCDERDLLLLEDAGQAWLASNGLQPVGAVGDLGIFCLYKMVGVPDGGALVTRAQAPAPATGAPAGLGPLAKRHALWAVQRSRTLATLAAGLRSEGRYDPDEDFALGDPESPPTSATHRLLSRLADDQVAPRRRANYRLLLESLADRVPAPFDLLPPGACPFALPVETDREEELVARLADRGVEGVGFWSVPHPSLPAERFPGAASRRGRTVCVPVHQELRSGDLNRIAAALERPVRRRTDVRLEPIASFDRIADQWDDLAAADSSVFATREWLSTWWRHFGRDRRLLLTGCRSPSGELIAILPVYRATSRGARVLRLLGHGTADQMGPVCAPEKRPQAARALRRLLDDNAVGWDFFLGELMPGDESWAGRLGARTIARDGYPILRFEHATWSEYLAARSRRFRKLAGQLERRLRKAHDVRVRLVDDEERLSDDLDTLFALHRLGWSDEVSPFGARERFHRELAAQAFRRGWLYLWFLEVDGTPVVAEYTFRFAGAQNHFQGGRDPEWDHASVGSVLFTDSVRDALEAAGLGECRFLRGRHDYKYRFANADPGLETVAVARGSFGESALAAAIALRPWQDVGPLRRWLGG